MYLDRKHKCRPDAFFDVPHKAKPVTAAYIQKRFPSFAQEMDGCSEDRCLLYYWKRNKETKVYEFLDDEAEDEVAELFGVSVFDEEEEQEKQKQKYLQKTRVLTDEEIKEFKEELAHVSQQLKQWLRSTTTSSLELQQEPEDSDSDSDSSHTIL
jgi:hypothetical protein